MEDYDGYKFNMAWCNSFILNRSVVDRFYDIVKDEKPSGRYKGSVQSERYLSAILYYLNNKRYISICGDASDKTKLGYDCWEVNIESNGLAHSFVKEVQQKHEKTI